MRYWAEETNDWLAKRDKIIIYLFALGMGLLVIFGLLLGGGSGSRTGLQGGPGDGRESEGAVPWSTPQEGVPAPVGCTVYEDGSADCDEGTFLWDCATMGNRTCGPSPK